MKSAATAIFIAPKEYRELQAKRAALKAEWSKTQQELGKVISGSSSFVNKTPGFDETEMQLHRVEEQIEKIDKLLDQAQLITDIKKLDSQRVTIYSLVKVENIEDHESFSYYIQHIFKPQPNPIIITPTSPIGRQLLGKKIGDKVTVNLPEHTLKLQIKRITKHL